MSNTREKGFYRLTHIIGNPKATPPIPPIIPVGASTWWAGIASGRFPKGIKLTENITAWRVEVIEALILEISSEESAND